MFVWVLLTTPPLAVALAVGHGTAALIEAAVFGSHPRATPTTRVLVRWLAVLGLVLLGVAASWSLRPSAGPVLDPARWTMAGAAWFLFWSLLHRIRGSLAEVDVDAFT